MDGFRRCNVPAFGSWNSSDDLDFTRCFEAARQVGLFPCDYFGGRDLYVGDDLYGYDVVAPAVFVVPRRRRTSRNPHVSDNKKRVKSPPSPVAYVPPLSSPPVKKVCKPVDEDLYKISPELLRAKQKRNRGWGIFSSCLIPICAA